MSVQGMAEILVDILERVNQDKELVGEINQREDLGYPDLQSALFAAKKVKEEVSERESDHEKALRHKLEWEETTRRL